MSTYGAYGDNYHNDTASIVKALATKLNIYLPKTTSGYYVDGELNHHKAKKYTAMECMTNLQFTITVAERA